MGKAVLIGLEDTENIGLRIISSHLKREGHRVQLVPFALDISHILEAIKTVSPDIVGFSLIFQNFAKDFQTVMQKLRDAGVRAHFTIGGHYPSFAYETLLGDTPHLDSVILYEGEDTIKELLNGFDIGSNWRKIPGLAWRKGNKIIANPLRPGRRDLDTLPWPDREGLSYQKSGLSSASLLGSRGCFHNCSFCSIAPFYRKNGTPGRRFRSPTDVVKEMAWLYKQGAQVMMFQDDDFLGGGNKGIDWAHAIAKHVIRQELHKHIRWRISCRSDEISEETLQPLIDAGLAHVYLGVESGDALHLADLEKKTTAAVHMHAKHVILKLNISYDFGFMLMTPWSTFKTIRSNLKFLREFAGDGSASAGFCRTLPYAGTKVAKRLSGENRLLPGYRADYQFLDPRLDAFYVWVYKTFIQRNQHYDGTRNLLGLLIFETGLGLADHPDDPDHRERIRALTSASNQTMYDITEIAIDYIEELVEQVAKDDSFLAQLSHQHQIRDRALRQDLYWLSKMRTRQLRKKRPEIYKASPSGG